VASGGSKAGAGAGEAAGGCGRGAAGGPAGAVARAAQGLGLGSKRGGKAVVSGGKLRLGKKKYGAEGDATRAGGGGLVWWPG
jgi:hypothetical protein